jgi:hypothetical protein
MSCRLQLLLFVVLPHPLATFQHSRRPASSTCRGTVETPLAHCCRYNTLLIDRSCDRCSERHLNLAIWRKLTGTLPMDA